MKVPTPSAAVYGKLNFKGDSKEKEYNEPSSVKRDIMCKSSHVVSNR